MIKIAIVKGVFPFWIDSFFIINTSMSDNKTYCKSLTEVAQVLNVPYTQLYKHRHRPELNKSARGYNLKKIADYLDQIE